jgi:hypothetical protein
VHKKKLIYLMPLAYLSFTILYCNLSFLKIKSQIAAMKNLLIMLGLLIAVAGTAQKNKKPISPETPVNTADSALMKGINFRLIGPFRGGRSAAVTGSFKNKNTFYFFCGVADIM